MKTRLRDVAITMFCIASILQGDSALQQLYDAGGQPRNVPMPPTPTRVYNKSSDSSQSSQNTQSSRPSKSYRAPSTSAMVGATIFGTLLENVLFDSPASNQPDPETLRLQAEQQRLAQEEAERKAKERQIHHQKLMGSFKSVPSTSSTTEETSASHLAFKTAQTSDVSKIDTSSDEALRESASRPFDGGGSHTVFAERLNPTPLSKTSLSIPSAVPLCQNGNCSWPTKTNSVVTTLPKAQIYTKTVNLSKLSNGSIPNPKEFIYSILGDHETKSDKRYLVLNRLSYLTREIGKELLISITMKIIESTSMGDKLSLIKDVHDLAVDDMENAIKVASWLGSTQLDNPPEITSVSEAAKPFLLKAMGTSESFEEIASLISGTSELFGMSAKLSTIIKEMP
jgi:hypothetical protein